MGSSIDLVITLISFLESARRPATEVGIRGVMGCQETNQHSAPIGIATHVYDNLASSISISPSLTARKTWRQTVEANFEELNAQHQKAGVGAGYGPVQASFEQGIENAIKQAYTHSEETERVFEQTLAFNVPAGVKLTVLLRWKQIWQEGLIKLALTNGQVISVPFAIALEVSYDLETRTD